MRPREEDLSRADLPGVAVHDGERGTRAPTVLWLILRLSAIWWLLRPCSYLWRSTSRILRMDNLFWATLPPRLKSLEDGGAEPSVQGSPAPLVTQSVTGLEVDGICRNDWTASSGITGRHASESASPGHAFYELLNEILRRHGFDRRVEHLCERFYRGPRGRPSVTPGTYFRMLIVGFFEGLDSERAVAWRVADSLSLRKFLGYGLDEKTPDHSTISRTRRLYWLSTHQAVFAWVLKVLAEEGLLRGKTVAVDATTLEANAAMRAIVRRDDGTEYDAWLEQLAKSSGIETPTRQDLAKMDRKRPKKGSNKDWKHPHDPEARITKMKDGRTRLAHKLEVGVDMETGAVAAVTVQTMDGGDCASLPVTLDETERRLADVGAEPQEVVGDKGYHSNETMTGVKKRGLRTYVSEPNRGRRKWKGKRDAQKAVYGNRRRIRGERGKRLLRQRGEKLERTFAHLLVSGGMRRVHVRGQEEIRKRMLVHTAAFNLGLLIRKRFGFGTPRGLQGLAAAAEAFADASARLFTAIFRQIGRILGLVGRHTGSLRPSGRSLHNKAAITSLYPLVQPARRQVTSSTDC